MCVKIWNSCVQERNTARLSERLTLAEEAASLARSDAAESSTALAALHAENASHQEGGSELRNQVTALSTRVHELKSLADLAQQEAQAASHAVAVAAAKDATLSREQVLYSLIVFCSRLFCNVLIGS